jgi:hypothetical protein
LLGQKGKEDIQQAPEMVRSESSKGARNVLSPEMRLISGMPKIALGNKTRTNAALLHNVVLKLASIQQLSGSFSSSLPSLPSFPSFCMLSINTIILWEL